MPYVGDSGLLIDINMGEDMTQATNCTIRVRKPNNTMTTWTAYTSGNSVRYVTTATDLDTAGVWTLQPYIELPSASPPFVGAGTPVNFQVLSLISA